MNGAPHAKASFVGALSRGVGPSMPYAAPPQQYIVPSVPSPHEVWAPTETLVKRTLPATFTGAFRASADRRRVAGRH